jgi:hypothetical protein
VILPLNCPLFIFIYLFIYLLSFFLQGEDGMGGAGLGGSGFEFGVDPNEDPELALVSSQVLLYVL